jgi:type I restriction enzyme, R subunit
VRSSRFTDSVVEDPAFGCPEALGYQVQHGPDIAAGEPGAERSDHDCRDAALDLRVRVAEKLIGRMA